MPPACQNVDSRPWQKHFSVFCFFQMTKEKENMKRKLFENLRQYIVGEETMITKLPVFHLLQNLSFSGDSIQSQKPICAVISHSALMETPCNIKTEMLAHK